MKYSPSTNGFYHPDIHGNSIPADAVAVSPEDHATLLAAQARGQIIRPDENGCPVAITPAAPPAPTRAELYTAKQAEIRDGAEAMLTALAAEYAPLERQTWDQQAAEAEALQADADAPAPLVRAIAATRGMPVGELAARILANRTAWVAVSGHVVGQRLAYQDALEATQGLDDAQAADTIQGINPVYTLPEDA
jgi:ABC-type cobalt transport system substrate-binding protein